MNRLFLSIGMVVATVLLSGSCNETNGDADQSSVSSSNVKIEHLTSEAFIQKVFDYKNEKSWKFKGNMPVIIDFYATWCGPCKMIAPILEDLNVQYKGKVQIYKVDVDKERELAGAFGIQSIPAILFIPMNEQPQMANGALPKESFEQYIREVLKVKK